MRAILLLRLDAPLISFGGSALILTLVAIGMLLSFARAEPGAEKALAAHHGRLRALVLRQPVRTPSRTPVPAQRARRAAPARRPVARRR